MTAFLLIARLAQKLQVFKLIAAVFRARNDVVERQRTAAAAVCTAIATPAAEFAEFGLLVFAGHA